MAASILVNLERCVGCWTCSMACKSGNALPTTDYRIIVRTLGSGSGIDRPAGVYPNLTMGWMPIYNKSCVMCGQRVVDGNQPYCVYDCPTEALTFGDSTDPDSAFYKEMARLREAGYRVFELATWENSRANITYASKK